MLSRWFPRRAWPLAAPLLLAVAAASASPAAATPASPDVREVDEFHLPSGDLAVGAGEVLTLVTGDQVRMEPAGGDRWAVEVEVAPRAGGPEPQFEVLEDGEDLYVLPSDALALIPDRLDRELFNITKLVEYGYTDGVSVIVSGAPGAATARGAAAAGGMAVTDHLSSVDGYAATVAPDGAWWATTAPAGAGARTLASGFDKVWLDEIAEVALAESVPMIGAPQAWASGYDGSGMSVAVLDTGVDPNHPDLVGQVAAAENFSSEPDTSDGHGHGTHVAATVAGTGDGADGTYTGVAPGADLLIGKTCTSSGSCPNSAMIAAMEWAAPIADLVSMSIGTNTGDDGSHVLAQAVNNLTAEHDTLFVVAAANNGGQGPGSIGAPGSADAALTVGAVDKDGDLASFSSRGPREGDFAIKPDITAPGVGIVAARADGTSMGTPVNDLYTSANGTSMATPHVAGAAAIVLQQHRDLSAAQLKAALASTAVPNPDLTVYEQGGGLADIPAALDVPVLANPSPLDLGFFSYPHHEADPVSADVTYTNRTDAEITLDLTQAVTAADGTAVPGSALSVEPATVTVPAGGTATATVTLDPGDLDTGSYGGYLTAESDEGAVRTAVGFHLEQEMYEVTIEGFARDGRPARGASSLHVRHGIDWDVFAENSVRFESGVATLRVPPGPYFLGGTILTYDGDNRLTQDRTMVTVPTLEVNEDTTVVLDAREANEMTFEAPEHPTARPHDRSRVVLHFQAEQEGGITSTRLGDWQPTYALASDPPTVGERFEFYVNARVGEAPLIVEVVDPVAVELNPRRLVGSPDVDSDRNLPLVFAGQGAESDYDGLDVEGAVVLAERDGPDLADKETTARAHGAEALLVMNDTTGYFFGRVGDAEIPSLAISEEEGMLLRDQLADGEVTVRIAGTTFSPYLYDMFLAEPGGIPEDLHYVLDPDEMATVQNSFHGIPGNTMGDYRAAWRPYMTFGPVQRSELPGASQRTEYVSANDTLFRQDVAASYPSESSVKERDTFHTPGEHLERAWFDGPMKPSILEAYPPINPGFPVARTGDTISMELMEWWDNSEHYGVRDTGYDSGEFRVYQDGVQFGQTTWPRVRITNLSPEAHTYRFEVDLARETDFWPTSTRTHTAWTVPSAQPESGTDTLPFLLVDYDTALDLTNTAVPPRERRGPATVDLQVRHQVGAETSAIETAKFWVSYDDGETWQERPVRDVGDGNYQAILPDRDPDDTSGFVSIRTEIWDADGNGIEQEVIRAWQLAAR